VARQRGGGLQNWRRATQDPGVSRRAPAARHPQVSFTSQVFYGACFKRPWVSNLSPEQAPLFPPCMNAKIEVVVLEGDSLGVWVRTVELACERGERTQRP
jgi:hypothetical protein